MLYPAAWEHKIRWIWYMSYKSYLNYTQFTLQNWKYSFIDMRYYTKKPTQIRYYSKITYIWYYSKIRVKCGILPSSRTTKVKEIFDSALNNRYVMFIRCPWTNHNYDSKCRVSGTQSAIKIVMTLSTLRLNAFRVSLFKIRINQNWNPYKYKYKYSLSL